MAPPLTYYLENADSLSQSEAGFTLKEGKAKTKLYLLGSSYGGADVVTLSDIPDAITQILGSVSSTVGDGRLNRTLPLAHPQYPWLYASGTPTIRGIGQGYKYSGANLLEAPPFADYTAYPNYEFTVEFTPRPYVIAGDTSISKNTAKWYPVGSVNNGGTWTSASSPMATEWCRYTDWWYEKKFESITARQGFMKFRDASGGPANSIPYSDMPRLFLPDSLLKIVWYQVPYRFVTSTNSYIDGLIGYINQNKWTIWNPGELLYIGYTAHRYTPPVQKQDQVYTGSTGYIFSSEKWCDVEFLFLRTKRKLFSQGEVFAPNPGNANWVQGGWNLLPWLQDRQFHYATTVGASPDNDHTKWTPMFPSIEMGLLFTDPDASGVYQLPT